MHTAARYFVASVLAFWCAAAQAQPSDGAPTGAAASVPPQGYSIAATRAADASGFSPNNQTLFLNGDLTGSGLGPFALISARDVATDLTEGTALVAMRVDDTFGGSGAGPGSRTALQAILNQRGQTPGTNDSLKFYTAIFGQTYAYSADGGTAAAPRGDYYGMAALAQLEGGANFVDAVTGEEVDVSVQAGASAAYKSVLTLIGVNADAVQGSRYDAMLGFTRDQTTKTGFTYGIAFGRPDSTWPIAEDGTLIGAVQPGSGARVAANGVDWRGATFSGYAFASNGYAVDGAGNVQATGLALSGGLPPAASGTCAIAAPAGGNQAGSFTANGACAGGTIILTFGATQPNGYVCAAQDETTSSDTLKQTAHTPRTCTLTGALARNDVVVFTAVGF